MKHYLLITLLCTAEIVVAQPKPPTEHIFVITTDGFRWQEVFSGADSLILSNEKYVKDKDLTQKLFWDQTPELRRKKLMPFIWNVMATEGLIYGNRSFQNNVNMSNFYRISYPGYNELLTGYADPILNPNLRLNNRNRNILEFLNEETQFKGKVAVFGSWNVFPFIFNGRRNNLPMNCGYQQISDSSDSSNFLINKLQSQISIKTHTRFDLLTFCAAMEFIRNKHPSVVFIGFGETDEVAHHGRYDLYLQRANAVDRMIAELWYFLQTDPEYKDRSTLIITTDHGRGENSGTWNTHGPFTKGSANTWLACIGPGIPSSGEVKLPGQIFAKQIAATIGRLLGEHFESDRKIGKPLTMSFEFSADEGKMKTGMVSSLK